MVLVTTPPHPASNARMMLLSDSVGGADDSRNGFVNLRPVKLTEISGFMRRIIGPLSWGQAAIFSESLSWGQAANLSDQRIR